MAILRYPLEALTGTTDYLQIDIKEYILSNLELPYFPNKKKLAKYLKFDKKKQLINFN